MHHYGEDAVRAEVSEDTFKIFLQNHVTGAVITVSGPIKGIFENRTRKLNQMTAENLGRELAHFLRQNL